MVGIQESYDMNIKNEDHDEMYEMKEVMENFWENLTNPMFVDWLASQPSCFFDMFT